MGSVAAPRIRSEALYELGCGCPLVFLFNLLGTSLKGAFRPVVPCELLSDLGSWMSSFPLEKIGVHPSPMAKGSTCTQVWSHCCMPGPWCPQPRMTMSLPCVFLWSCGRLYCWRCPIKPNLPLLLTPLSQPHPQRPEPRHVPSPAAPGEQDSQQVHRPGPAGQLHTIPSTLSPP